jgi:hypothetical protein
MAKPRVLAGNAYIFEPNGFGTFPRYQIRRMETIDGGVRKLDHYRIEVLNRPVLIEQELVRRTWVQVERYFDYFGYGDQFRKVIPRLGASM